VRPHALSANAHDPGDGGGLGLDTYPNSAGLQNEGNPILRLQQCAARLRAGVADPEGALWIQAAIESYMERGESLEQALFSVGRGGTSPRYQLLLERRNALLRQARDAAGGVAGLLREIEAYDRVSAVERGKLAPNPSWSKVRQLIHDAKARTGINLPDSRSGLAAALARADSVPV
jgi:hypothetical protein